MKQKNNCAKYMCVSTLEQLKRQDDGLEEGKNQSYRKVTTDELRY